MVFDFTAAKVTGRSRRWCVRAAAIAAVCVMAACASGPRRPPVGTLEPDKFLFERGTEELNDKDWFTAREYFRQLVDSYPQSPYRGDAKLGVGDTFLGEGTAEAYVLGINEFREFLSYYPTHSRADYAQFKLGMAHYYQMRGPMRDQTETLEAIKELTTFVQRYPRTCPPGTSSSALRQCSDLLPEAQKRLREARDRLGDHELGVGLQYFRQKWYPGAIERLKPLLDRDPQFTRRDAALFYLAESFDKGGRPAEALPYYDRLLKEFERSEFLQRAEARATAIRSQMDNKQEAFPMSSDAHAISAAALLLALTGAPTQAQQPVTARLSGIPRDVACAPASPVVRPKPTLKILAGKESRKTLFGTGDAVVISGGTAQGIKNGDEFYVRRIVGDHFTEAVRGGTVPVSIHTAGMLQIVEAQTDVSIGLITYGCDGVLEGDYLDRFAPEPLPAGTTGNTPDFARPGHVIMGDDRRQMGGPGEFVVIDRGSDHGVRQGQQVTIFRHTLPDRTGPVTTVGSATVYVVKPQTSLVRLERSVDAVYIGDLVAIHR